MNQKISASIISDSYYYFTLPCKHLETKVLAGCTFLSDSNGNGPKLPLALYRAPGEMPDTIVVKAPCLGDTQQIHLESSFKGQCSVVSETLTTDQADKRPCEHDATNATTPLELLSGAVASIDKLEMLYPDSYEITASRYCPLGATIALKNRSTRSVLPQNMVFFDSSGKNLEARRHPVETILGDSITQSFDLWDIELPETPDLIVVDTEEECPSGSIIQDARGAIEHLFVSRLNAYDIPSTYVDKDAVRPNHLPAFVQEPFFSIIVPLFNTPLNFFREMVDSVLEQDFTNFELVLVNASTDNEELTVLVNTTVESDERIRRVSLPENLGITENTNAGIDMACGEFLCFLDHDDVLDRDALGSYARALSINPDIDLFYSDEDMLENGRLCKPLFKPDFNLDLLRSKNYIIHFLAIRTELFKKMPRPNDRFDGAQDYNATLFACENARCIHHVQKPLYHWRIHTASTAVNPDAKPYAENAGCIALQEHLDRTAAGATARRSAIQNIYSVDYPTPIDARLSIIAVEGSKIEDEPWAQENEILFAPDFSAASLTEAVRCASAPYVLFLDRDDVVCTPASVGSLVALCARNDVGAVGMKVVDCSGVIETNGYVLPFGRALPLFQDLEIDDPGYLYHSQVRQNVSAVSIHGLLTSTALFDKQGGFTKHPIDIGVPYCKAVQEQGLLVVQEPSAVIRCNTFARTDRSNQKEEFGFPDPLFNENFDCGNPRFALNTPNG